MRARALPGGNRPEAEHGPTPPCLASIATLGAASNNTFAKGLYVLEVLVEAGSPVSLSGLVARTGLPKTTVHRLVSVLVERGWAKMTGRGYGLGFLPLRAAAAFERSLDIRFEAEPYLVELRNTFAETVHLATLDQEFRIVYLDKLVPRFQAVGLMRSRVGATAIRGRHEEPIAAISLSGPAARMAPHLDESSSTPAAVREAADAISLVVGGTVGGTVGGIAGSTVQIS